MTRAVRFCGCLAVLALAASDQRAKGDVQRPPRGPEIFARGIVSTEAPEFAVTFTPDGREGFFNRASADRQRLAIMITTRTPAGAWSAPVVAAFSGTFRDIDPFVTPDGRRLYFSSDRPRGAAGRRHARSLRELPCR